MADRKHENWAQKYDAREDKVYEERIKSNIEQFKKSLKDASGFYIKIKIVEEILQEYKKLIDNVAEIDEEDYWYFCDLYAELKRKLDIQNRYKYIKSTEEDYGIPGDREFKKDHNGNVIIKNKEHFEDDERY